MKVYIEPIFNSEDKGDGGVRRVVEAQQRWLPEFGVEVVEDIRQADVVNVHISPLAQTERYLQMYPHVPLVASSHGLYWAEYDWKGWKSSSGRNTGGDWCYAANADCMELIRRAQIVTAPSEWVAQSIRRNTLRRVIAIGHGINLDEWEEPPEAGRYVLWNKTRIDPICDPEPVNELARRAPDVAFISTFGDDSLKNVAVTGRLPYGEAKDFIRNAAVYLATPRETFGIGALEAMACGVPVLGWRWGGQADVVQHKKTGYLAAVGDYDELAEGLAYCLKNRTELGRAARAAAVEDYQWKPIIARYAEAYETALGGARRAQVGVSVVVPAHGLERWLPEALDSVAAQSMGDWECIVVDDASPDRCGEIAESYAARDPRFRVIHNAENQYLAGALNTGVAAARGRYILPLDADNTLFERALEHLAAALDERRDLHIAYGNVEFLKTSGERWHSGWPPPFKIEWQVLRNERAERANNLIPSTAMYRREVWELTGGYRRRYRTAEDADFWTRASSYGLRAERVTEADIFTYRDREDSMSRVERTPDWTLWMPWSRAPALLPSGVASEEQLPISSFEPTLISVIIPVGRGHEELLVDALDSVDAQTFRLWECIVVNDTGAPLRWTPSWARVINTTGGIGVAAARNLGLHRAKARLFLPLDADDTLEPEALSRLYEAQREIGGYVYSDWYDKFAGKEMKTWATPEYNSRELLTKGCLHAITALYPLDAWQQVGGFDEELPAWEDWDFQLRLARAGICGSRYPMPLFTYRKDTGQRREENYAEFEKSKQGILDKWKAHFEGKETFMGCGCGGKKVNPPQMNIQRQAALPPPDSEKYATIEFTGAQQGARTFRGPSGQVYRFSALQSEKMKLVNRADVEFFLARRDFRLVERREPAEVVS